MKTKTLLLSVYENNAFSNKLQKERLMSWRAINISKSSHEKITHH